MAWPTPSHPLRYRPGVLQRRDAGLAARRGIRIDFIQPGQPQQNAYVERYNRTVRYNWLAHHLFETLDEMQDFCDPLAVDLQSRPAQYGAWRHCPKTETCLGRLTSTFSAL